MGWSVLRFMVGLLLAVFLVPLFCAAGFIGGCLLMAITPDSSASFTSAGMIFAVSASILAALAISFLIARSLGPRG